MSISQTLLPEFDLEMVSTRKVLERIPTDKGKWKPHPKSFSLGHLAQLVSTMPGWLTNAVLETELDLGAATGYSYEKTETLLQIFDKNVREARKAIAAAKDTDFTVPWSLKHGDRVIFTLPRAAVVRQTATPRPAHGLHAHGRRSGAVDLRTDGRRACAWVLAACRS